MLGDSNVSATIPVKDLEESKRFYEQTLGLKNTKEEAGGVTYESGQSQLFVYPSQYAGTNQATAASWEVGDIEAAVESLRQKGVTFEQYDNLPGVTRQGDIHTMGNEKGVWFKDPSENILSVVERT